MRERERIIRKSHEKKNSQTKEYMKKLTILIINFKNFRKHTSLCKQALHSISIYYPKENITFRTNITTNISPRKPHQHTNSS
jgi:hypothetical protein